MQFGYHEAILDHETGPLHPETVDRIEAILDELEECDDAAVVETTPASRATVEAVHETAYVDELEAFCGSGGGTWDGDTVANGATLDAALASAGAACWAVDRALGSEPPDRTPFALCRPPGHHALADDAMGFCFLNNVAVAARKALERPGIDRVAILDWDVHHGNGTEEVFRGDDHVLYASIHQRGLFPGTGTAVRSGRPGGRASALDVPLPGGAGDAEYDAALESVVVPRLTAFTPDLVLVSAGFDASEDDHTSRTCLTTDGYARTTARVRDLATTVGAGLAFVLEGGYQPASLARNVRTVHETLAGGDPVDPPGTPDPDVVEVLDAIGAAPATP